MKLFHQRIKFRAIWGTASFALIAAAPDRAHGALMHSGSSYDAHKALGVATGKDALWVQAEYQGYIYYYSAIRINAHYAITAGHAVLSTSFGLLNPQVIGNGTNYLTDPGSTSSIAEIIVYPTYGGSATGFNEPDIAILRLATPIAGASPTFATSITTGEIVKSAGYGQPGFTGGSFSIDGSLIGWNAPVMSETSGSFNSSYFGNTRFSSALSLDLNGAGSDGDSGSPVYNSRHELVGMTVGGPYTTSQFSSTIFLDLTLPTIRAWILANTVVPEPPKITVAVILTSAHLTFSNLLPAREYRVMRSPTLAAWAQAHSFIATGATDSWGESLANGGKMFYRLEWNE